MVTDDGLLTAGIDAGASRIKVALFKGRRLLGHAVLEGGAENITEISKRALADTCRIAGITLEDICKIAVTGMAYKYVHLEVEHINESTCLARGIDFFMPEARTAIDVGAQKSLAMKCKGGVPLKIRYSEKCASGSGRFLDVVAATMAMDKAELSRLGLSTQDFVEVQSTCTIFAESEIITLIHSDAKPAEIARGAYRALARRLYGLLLQVGLEDVVCVAGGVSADACLLDELTKLAGCEIKTARQSDIVMACGAALAVQ
ncbi:MAG: acyl-CoA dehydratase activase [Dehalococcoidia bacterium]|nr:acyl-CoA dehydratase activase [Dehalococcoidia bacterium]